MNKKNLIEIKGELTLVGAAFFYSLFSVCSRLIGTSFAPFYQTWTRTLVALFFLAFLTTRSSFKKIEKADLAWFILVIIGGSFVNTAFFVAAVNMPLATTMFIFYAISTIFSYFIGSILFKENINILKIFSILFAVFGLGLIYSDGLIFEKLFFIFLAALSGILFSVYTMASKKISHKYSGVQINYVAYISMIIINLATSLILHENFNLSFFSIPWLANILYGFAAVGAYLLIIKGFKTVEMQKGSIILLFEIIFVVIFGVILFKEIPTRNSIIGGVLIIIAMIIPNLKLLKNA